MTLDDLYAAYAEAYENSLRFLMVDGAAEDRAHRAGIAAVVRALKPSLVEAMRRKHMRTHGHEPFWDGEDIASDIINEILGSDAGAAGAAESNPAASLDITAGPTSANSFCEWASHPPHGNVFRSCIGIVVSLKDAGEMCSWCGKPIRFKEEKKP